MHKRTFLTAVLALLALAVPAGAAAAAVPSGAVVFSRVVSVSSGEGAEEEGGAQAGEPALEVEGGLYAARAGRLNQLTENAADREPAFAPDGRTIAFVRDGDVYAMRADGSGQHQLTSGAELDSAPRVAPNGRYVVFERRAAAGAPADLFAVRVDGSGLRALVASPADEHDAVFSPDGRVIAFVRSSEGGSDDIYSVRPASGRVARLTRTTRIDEFEPRFFAGGVVFSRGESGGGAGAYADLYTMRRDGRKVKPLVAGTGSAYLEDASPAGRAVLFRRDQGLWVKRIGGGRARKLTQLPDGSRTNAVFSSDGRWAAAFVAADGRAALSAIEIASGRTVDLAQGADFSAGGVGTSIGPVIAWQPSRQRRR